MDSIETQNVAQTFASGRIFLTRYQCCLMRGAPDLLFYSGGVNRLRCATSGPGRQSDIKRETPVGRAFWESDEV
jgi:hypothetical protein